ncbi:CAP domain-containing protein [Streptomyces sp. CT34]|uniref:CAP domain-containing protein n=1 Tax=Streptomyces sp. CT34 TaxID=1553907 RepID=UPI0005BC14FC|nr:CAP domain-containing protein [Streptomyces sp. CT34]
MGRHRRSAPHAPESPGTGPVDGPAGAPPAARHRAHHAARPRRSAPVRTGLLGASAAMAMGAVAVASGLVPGGGQFVVGGDGDHAERVRADALPDLQPQESRSAAPAGATDPATGSAGRQTASPDTGQPSSPDSPGSPASTASPSASPSPGRASASPTATPGARHSAQPTGRPTTAAPTSSPTASKAPETGASAAAQVLSLVNEQRERAGCSPLADSGQLDGLAQHFSEDMAQRGFFGHTDPDGHTPWDRARVLGIANLGGENIARGQADARAVMDTWMNSAGHRANILNCEYKTLGVGAHFGPGGPWWTQEFGF